MATYRQNIITRMEVVAAELAAIDHDSMGGHANVKTEDGGTTIDHVGYKKALLAELADLERRLAGASAVEAAMAGEDGPFEIESRCDV